MSCDEYKRNLTSGLFPYEILVFLNPVDDNIWTERDDVWRSIFKVYIGLLGSIYLMLGLFAITMLIKKDCVRLATKTFFAVYSTIAVLGFSRVLLLALDPYDLLGYISESFPQWIIITRLLGSFGFPSLVASYTLMVFTLLKIAKANPGKQWYHKWRFVIPIVVTPYVIAIGAEVIGYLAEYPGLLSVIICEMAFAVWGLTVLITYLIAGGRLMHQLRKRERNTVRISASGMARSAELGTQNDFAAQEYQRHHQHNRRTARKIAIITYATVFMACLYSLLTFGNIIMVCLFIFKDCLAHMGIMGNSAAWLGLHISTRATEITLATIMLYSITDMSGVMKFMYRMFVAMCRCKKMKVTECSRLNHPLANGTLNNDSYSNTCTLNRTPSDTQGSHSHREALIGTDHNTNSSNGVITADESPRSSEAPPEEEETTTTATIFQERVDLSGMASLGDSGIQLEATDDGQENHPVVNNVNGDDNNNTASNSPRTFLLHASSKGESSSSIDSATMQENSQLAALPLQTSKQITAPIIVSRTKADSTEALAQTEIRLESQGDVDDLHFNSAYVPYTSPDITMEHTIVEVETQTTELSDKACQTELSDEPAPSGSSKPVAKPRRFAPKSPRERREMQRQQKQLPQTSFSSKLKRQQTV
jgi:hypothetical protein